MNDSKYFSILQLVMGIILVAFGYLLNGTPGALTNAPLVFCVVPGLIIILSDLLNLVKFKHTIYLTFLVFLLTVGGYALIYGMRSFELTNGNMIVMGVIALLTSLLCSLFYMLGITKS